MDEMVARHVLVHTRDIAYIQFLSDAYEGLGLIRSYDPGRGHMVWMTMSSCERELDALLNALSEEFGLRVIAPPEDYDPDFERFLDRPEKLRTKLRRDLSQ